MLNAHVRDNLNETMPAKVTTAGDLAYGTAANAITRLAPGTSLHVLHMAGVGAGSGTAPRWGPVNLPHRTLAADGTLTVNDSVIYFNAASGTITLPAAQNGLYFNVKKINAGAGTVSIVAAGSIDGAGTLAFSTQYQSYTLHSNGTTFFVL